MTSMVFILTISLAIVFGIIAPAIADTVNVRTARDSRASLFTAQGSLEDVIYRIKTGKNYSAVNELTLNTTSASTTVADILGGGKQVTVSGETRDLFRNLSVELSLGSGVSFNFGVQSGEGGIVLQNSSSVNGNVYSNGPVTGSGNIIRGTAVSAGPSGLIDDIHATSTVYAHSIVDSTIDGDAYYESISGTVVYGVSYSSTPDTATSTLPITDAQIEEWKADALLGGVISSPCPYKITDSVSLGPVKIDCDVEISGNNYDITLNGSVWVAGDIDIKNSPTMKVNPSLGNQSVVVIADEPSNRNTSGKISLENSASFEGSGGANSYVLMLSKNESAKNGGSAKAISVANSVVGDLLIYAGSGQVTLSNSVDLKEVTAYKIVLKNTAEVTYASGLSSLLFTSGPGGGYEILSWKEVE